MGLTRDAKSWEGARRALHDESGQALILGLGGAAVVIAGALALVAIAGAITGKGRAQRAADLAAISAARSFRDDLQKLLAPPTLADGRPNPAHIDKAAYLARARQAALDAGRANDVDPARLRLTFPDAGSFAPVQVRATVIGRLEGVARSPRSKPPRWRKLPLRVAPRAGWRWPAAAATAGRSSFTTARGCARMSPPPTSA
ncbi:MAG TPA: hypothetical protein VHR18_03300 [Solirubrobacterales bacterium]|jgi:hypothetical protein|nr:hypothetical protein [Solirubrobacterales bacterium]